MNTRWPALLLLLLLLRSLAPAAATAAQRGTGAQAEAEGELYSGGVSVLLDSVPAQRRDPASNLAFMVAPGEPLVGHFRLVHVFPDAKPVRVLLLLDYRPAPFALTPFDPASDRPPVPLAPLAASAEFVAEPGAELAFGFRTGPLRTGYHDLALVVVLDPDVRQRDLPYSTAIRPTVRRSVYVGEDAAPPTVAFPAFDPAARENPGFDEVFMITEEPYGLTLWPGRAATPGEDVGFFLSVQPHPDNLVEPASGVPLALVAFADDRVVPLNGEPVLYGSARPGFLSALSVSVPAPAEPGAHQVFVQQFPHPYVDTATGLDNSLAFFAPSSHRIVLTIEP